MELSNEFEVPVPLDQAWDILTDIERIAPCLPGAQLQEVEGDEYRGIVKVKVGPITAQYKGVAASSRRTTSPTGRCCRPAAATPGARATRRPTSGPSWSSRRATTPT